LAPRGPSHKCEAGKAEDDTGILCWCQNKNSDCRYARGARVFTAIGLIPGSAGCAMMLAPLP